MPGKFWFYIQHLVWKNYVVGNVIFLQRKQPLGRHLGRLISLNWGLSCRLHFCFDKNSATGRCLLSAFLVFLLGTWIILLDFSPWLAQNSDFCVLQNGSFPDSYWTLFGSIFLAFLISCLIVLTICMCAEGNTRKVPGLIFYCLLAGVRISDASNFYFSCHWSFLKDLFGILPLCNPFWRLLLEFSAP